MKMNDNKNNFMMRAEDNPMQQKYSAWARNKRILKQRGTGENRLEIILLTNERQGRSLIKGKINFRFFKQIQMKNLTPEIF
jgi:hypothetical protein